MDLHSIQRGLADADAGRTVSLDQAHDEWMRSADERTTAASLIDVLIPAAIGIGLGLAAYSHFRKVSEPLSQQEEELEAESAELTV